jgi:glucose/arabinose dehydrogenase
MLGRRILLAGCGVATLVVSACASFNGQPPPAEWTTQQPLTPQAGPQPQVPNGAPTDGGGGRGGAPPQAIPPPNGCTDYDPRVIATCLDPVSAIAVLPGDGDPIALVGERRTGRILRVRKNQEPVVVATLKVDASTDGGLTGLARSPTYAEDRLLFAYITTETDNRLVRIADGDTPKPVLTGIPRGPSGNRGALALDHRGALLLVTGDAGTAAAATDPNSLAGKVLRINTAGKPADGNPAKDSAMVAAGAHTPGGVCSSLDGSRLWFTDRDATRDVLYRFEPGKPLGQPAWTWPDRPGAAGCISSDDGVGVAMSVSANLQLLPVAKDGTFKGKPQITFADKDGFGRLGAIDLISPDGTAVAGTVNKAGGTPLSSDDRAVVISTAGGGGSGPD